MDHELRTLDPAELPAAVRAHGAAFGHHPTDEDVECARLLFDPDRSLAAFDGGEVVATAGAMPLQLSLPGGTAVPAAGVTDVGVVPTHRRRGLLTAIMDRQLTDVAGRGEAVAVLITSETAIYGRFGYGLASSTTSWRLATEGSALTRPPSAAGQVRLVGAGEAAAVLPDVHDRTRRHRPGAVSRPPGWWRRWFRDRERDRDGASARFYAVHEGPDGRPGGYAAYRVGGGWEHGLAAKDVTVADLHATGAEVEAALWRFLLDLDLVVAVQASRRPVDEALRWRLADPRRLVVTEVVDDLWLRLLDVPTALAARRYGTEDRLVVELTDAFRPANGGRYLVEGGPAGAVCARTGAGPDLAMTVADLGTLYLGGVPATVLAAAGRVVEHRPGALARADAFLGTAPAPWCGTFF